MPLGVLTPEQEAIELNRFGLKQQSNVVSFEEIKRGRGNKTETPEGTRALIATEALSGANVTKLSEEYNISPSSISAYKNGATSTSSYNSPDNDLTNQINDARSRIIGPAQSRIIKAIESISDSKLETSKARDAASIAAALSSVVKNLTPDRNTSNNNTVIQVFAPRKNEEEDYEVIQVNQ